MTGIDPAALTSPEAVERVVRFERECCRMREDADPAAVSGLVRRLAHGALSDVSASALAGQGTGAIEAPFEKPAHPSPVGGELDDATLNDALSKGGFPANQHHRIAMRKVLAALPSRVGDGDAREAVPGETPRVRATVGLTAAVLYAVQIGLTPGRIREVVEEDLPPGGVQDAPAREERWRIVAANGTPVTKEPRSTPGSCGPLREWDEDFPENGPHHYQRCTVTTVRSEWVDVPVRGETDA